jgi:hypothetical protein
MRLLTLLTFTVSALAAALPAEQVDVAGDTPWKSYPGCGKAYTPRLSGKNMFWMYKIPDGCWSFEYPIDHYENKSCGLCTWFKDHYCQGGETQVAGNHGSHKILPSKSVRCLDHHCSSSRFALFGRGGLSEVEIGPSHIHSLGYD